jgi:predicted RNase H-like nuclease (RuvC/YqgF family)
MNMETPRTDKAVKESNGQWSYALVDTCKQLERELAEARDQLEGAGKLMTACDVLVRDLAEARTQRDMLAEALQELNDAPWLNMPGRACDIVQDALAAVKGASHE